MGQREPKVSVVIPVYNGANYLRLAIESALAQTYGNIEIIVVNDGSTDDGATDRIAKSYGERIRYCRKPNGGVATALNRGLAEMTGDYFSWLSHDDEYYPLKIRRQVDRMLNEPPRTVLYSDYDVIDENSNVLRTERIRHVSPDRFRLMLMISYPLHGCTALIPRRCLEEVGLFDERLRTTQDYDMWFRMAERCRFVHMPEILIRSRVHPEQGTVKVVSRSKEVRRLYISFIERMPPQELLLASDEGSMAKAYAEVAENFRARGLLGASWNAIRKGVALVRMGKPSDILRGICALGGVVVRHGAEVARLVARLVYYPYKTARRYVKGITGSVIRA